VARMARKGDVQGLIEALSYRDVVADRDGRLTDLGIRARIDAAAALGRLAHEEVVGPLVEALRTDASLQVRVMCARALGAAGWASAADPLAQVAALFVDESLTWVRTEAIEALVALGDPSAVHALARHLMYRDQPPDISDADRDAVRTVPGWDLPDTRHLLVDQLIEALAEEEEAVHQRVAAMLSWLDDVSLQPLLDALSDPHRRCGAALALGQLHDARAVAGLVDVLDDPDPEVRRRASWSLGELHDPIAVESLIRVTRDENYAVRLAAGEALDKLGSVAVVLGVAAFMRPMLANAGAVEQAPAQPSLPESTDAVPAWLRPVLHKLIAGEEQGAGAMPVPPQDGLISGEGG
jgi:HEAT repeat protein